MPQFDVFSWMSMGFWTILSFHFFYLYVVKRIISPFSELQKSTLKLNWLLTRKFLLSLRIRIFRQIFFLRKLIYFKVLGSERLSNIIGMEIYSSPFETLEASTYEVFDFKKMEEFKKIIKLKKKKIGRAHV